MADAYCECTASLVRLNRQVDTAEHRHLSRYFEQIETAYEQARECMAAVIGQYGLLNDAEMDSLRHILQYRCPAVADQRDLLQELLGQ